MSVLDLADPAFIPEDGLVGLVMVIIRLIAYAALAAVALGVVVTFCCCLFDGRKLKACQGRSVFWRLMH